MSFYRVRFYVPAAEETDTPPDARIFLELLVENANEAVDPGDSDMVNRVGAFLGVIEDAYRAGRTRVFPEPWPWPNSRRSFSYTADFFVPVEDISPEELSEMHEVVSYGFYPAQGFSLEGTASSF